MKIAIPTQDGLHLTIDFGKADTFLIVTIQSGEVMDEELRKNRLNTYMEKKKGPLVLISDCTVVLVHKMDTVFCKLLQENHIEYIKTDENLITNAILRYLEHEYRKEANTCCCP